MVFLLALAELLAAAGERVGLLGESDLILARNAAERIARFLARAKPAEPETRALRRFTDVVLIGDFLDPIADIEVVLDRIVRSGARAHLVQIFDPIEETFPFSGRTEFHDPETGLRHVVGRAEQYRQEYHDRLAALRERLSAALPPARLDVPHPPHRPAGIGAAACAPCPPRRPPVPRQRGRGRTRGMSGLPFAFAYPPVLFALLALPAIWWLMRVFPPRPRMEVLPTTRLLLEIARKEEAAGADPLVAASRCGCFSARR